MKVVFVASGNKTVGAVSAFVQTQFDSLVEKGVDMILFPIVGHGFFGYLRNLSTLRRLIKNECPDIVHAHYSVCGYLASMASRGLKNKVVVSLLGSFPDKNMKYRTVRFFINHFWDAVIVKSDRTKAQLGMNLPVIPNGVDLDQFSLLEKDKARDLVGFKKGIKYVIFVSDPSRKEKNYQLAQTAVDLMEDDNVVLLPIFKRPHNEVVTYMCAADALLMTSLKEGSPNVIKEAMACNCPLVVTDVGDVRWITDGVDGAFVSDSFNAEEVAGWLKKALSFGTRTCGRERIISLGLTTDEVANRIIKLYKSVVDG